MKTKNEYYCDSCGKILDEEIDHIQEPNPYAEEINNTIIKEDLCESCYHEACRDI